MGLYLYALFMCYRGDVVKGLSVPSHLQVIY